jgi:hypothetical protein
MRPPEIFEWFFLFMVGVAIVGMMETGNCCVLVPVAIALVYGLILTNECEKYW